MDTNSTSPAVAAHLEKLFQRADQLTDKQRLAMVTDFERCQHFLEDMLEGYEFDLEPPALEAMAQCYFVIWEHFKDKKNSQKRAIAESQFIRLHKRNLQAIQASDNPGNPAFSTLFVFQNPASVLLMEGIQKRFEGKPELQTLPLFTRTELLLDLRSLIDCFEEVTR
ncbi:MAG: hypothetical protein IPN95_01495 [Bacteroidetes bacterium]|nr:hypothetical protein [Bacteroidota bacterium]